MAVVLLGCVLTIAIAPGVAPDNSSTSSYTTGRAGTWALFQLASRLGARTERLSGSGFSAALGPGETLVEAAPSTPFTRVQLRAVRHFLDAGGTLVYALGNRYVDAPMLASLAVTTGARTAARSWLELLPLGGSARLTVRWGAGPSLSAAGAQALPLVGSVAHPVALVEAVGRGRAVLLNSEVIISNAALRERDNAEFSAAVLGILPGRRVLFDEIHHGYSLGDGAEALLVGTPLGLVTALCALLVLTFLFTSGRRLGAPLPPAELVSVRSTADHLDALAQLYLRSKDRQAVAGRYLQQLRTRAGSLQHLPPTPGVEPSGLQSRFEAACRELEAAARTQVEPGRLRRLAEEADQLGRELEGADPKAEEVQVR
ncbi:MAG: DUF4350 domain-containing protein [Candidatus Dormibacteria bacterium]